MPFTLRPCRFFPLQCVASYSVALFLKPPLTFLSVLGSS
jgi:hypothetical protein